MIMHGHFHRGHRGPRHFGRMMPPPPPPRPFMLWRRPYIPGGGCCSCGGCMMSVLGVAVFALMMLVYVLF